MAASEARKERRLCCKLEEEWNISNMKTGWEKSSVPLGRDMWSQLKRIPLWCSVTTKNV